MSKRQPPLRWKLPLTLLAVGVGTLLLSRFATGQGWVEAIWGGSLVRGLNRLLSRITGWFPFSLAELLFFVLIAGHLLGAGVALARVFKKRHRLSRALGLIGLRLLRDAGILILVFYLIWGFNYARPSLAERADIDLDRPVETAFLASLAEEMTVATNEAYRELHGSDDLGRPTPYGDPRTLDAALAYGWTSRDVIDLGLDTAPYGVSKRPWLSKGLSWLGVGGFYFPLTGEANVNGDMPAIARAHATAHEQAHQRGVAPENEANFVGFVVAANAPDPLPRYSAFLFAQGQLLGALRRQDPQAAQRLREMRLPGVQRDIDDEQAYWRAFRGPAQRATRRVNDAYLKSNRVEGGIQSYGLSVRLLLAWARERQPSP